jgi:hypothetical protein
LNLKFEGIDFPKFIDEITLEINEAKLLQEVKNKSQKPNLDLNDLQKRLKQRKDPNYDRWQICRGHDFMSILSVGFRRAIGSQNSQAITVDILERSLRLAYEQAYFQGTQLYAAMVIWEKSHPPYRVLKLSMRLG